MRVVITHTDFRLYWIPRLCEFARLLHSKGHEVIVVEIGGKGSCYDFAGVDIQSIPHARWIRLLEGDLREIPGRVMSEAVYASLCELQPDIVFAGAIAYPSGATAVRWCRERRRPVVVFDNARHVDLQPSRIKDYVKRRLYANIDAMMLPAPSHKPDYCKWGCDPDRVFYGVNVIDNEWFSARAEEVRAEAEETKRRLDLPDAYILGVGRQVKKKNWATVIGAFSEFQRMGEGTGMGLVLVGDGPEHGHLVDLVEMHQITSVKFVPYSTQIELCSYYACASAFVLPSFYGETWGNVVAEAMSCGLPVLVSEQCGCSSTLVSEGENGWTFNPERTDELTALIGRIAESGAEKRLEMGMKSRAAVEEWPVERFAREALDAIDACKDSRRRYARFGDRILMRLWRGRFRPT